MKIKDATIDQTIREMARVMNALSALKAARKCPGRVEPGSDIPRTFRVREGKEHAAAKRASMDLSRTLSDLRAGR